MSKSTTDDPGDRSDRGANETSDDALFAECQAGRETAFAALIERKTDLVVSKLRSLGANATEIEDGFAATWCDVFKGRHAYQPLGNLDGWLQTIVGNCYKRQKRDAIAESSLAALDEDPPDPFAESEPIASILSNEQNAGIRSALGELSERERRIIEGRFGVEPVSLRDLADELKISMSAVSAAKKRALSKICQSLLNSDFMRSSSTCQRAFGDDELSRMARHVAELRSRPLPNVESQLGSIVKAMQSFAHEFRIPGDSLRLKANKGQPPPVYSLATLRDNAEKWREKIIKRAEQQLDIFHKEFQTGQFAVERIVSMFEFRISMFDLLDLFREFDLQESPDRLQDKLDRSDVLVEKLRQVQLTVASSRSMADQRKFILDLQKTMRRHRAGGQIDEVGKQALSDGQASRDAWFQTIRNALVDHVQELQRNARDELARIPAEGSTNSRLARHDAELTDFWQSVERLIPDLNLYN